MSTYQNINVVEMFHTLLYDMFQILIVHYIGGNDQDLNGINIQSNPY